MNRPLLLVGLVALTLPLTTTLRAQNPDVERYALLGVPAKRGNALEVRLLWLPKTGWLPAGGFALYRAKGTGPLTKIATLKPDTTLLPAELSAKASLGATTAKLTERAARPASALTAFREFKTTLEAPTSKLRPPVLVRKEAGALPSVKRLDPVRKTKNTGKKATPTPAEEAEELRGQIALAALTDHAKAQKLALAFNDPEVSEGDSVKYVLRGLESNGSEQATALGTVTVLVRAADATPPPPDAAGFSAVQLDQDSAGLHWEDPTETESDKLVLPRYDVYRDETKRNTSPILLTSHETASGAASSLISFQDDKLKLGPVTYRLTLTDAFGRTSAPVTTTVTMTDLRVPTPIAGTFARYELDRTTLGRPGGVRRFVRLYWAAPADTRSVVFDITRIDADSATSRTSLTGTTPIPGDSSGPGGLSLSEIFGLTGDTTLLGDMVAAATLDQKKRLTGLPVSDSPRELVERKLRAALQSMTAGDAIGEFPALQPRINALSARIRTTTDNTPPPDHYYRYELTASYAGVEGAHRSVATTSSALGVPLMVLPGAPTASGQWARNTAFEAGSLTPAGVLRDAPPLAGSGAFVKSRASTQTLTRPTTIKPIPARLGGTVNLSWGAVSQTPQMRYRIYRAVATGFFPQGVNVTQTGTGIGKHVTATGGLKLVYYSQYNNLKDKDYLLLGSTDQTSWSDPLPPSQRCVYLYKVEAVNRWGVAGNRSTPLAVTVAATLPPSTPNLLSVQPTALVNVDGALTLNFSPNPTEERVTEYRVLRMAIPVTTQVTMTTPAVRVASLGAPPVPQQTQIPKPKVSQLVGNKQLAPQGPEAQRVGSPSARFGVVNTGGGFRAIQKQAAGTAVINLQRLTGYQEVGKVTVPLGSSPLSLNYVDMTAKPGTEYAYRLVAVNDDTIGSLGSNIMDGRPFTKTMKPGSGTTTWDEASRTITLNWAAVPGAGGYFVRRQLGSGPALQLGALVAPTTTLTDPDARGGRTYTYQVFASDKAGGVSDPLNLTVVTTITAAVLPPGPNGPTQETLPTESGAPTFGRPILLENKLQLNVLSMKYSVEPHPDYEGTMPQPDQKLVWITFSLKNLDPGETRQFAGFDATILDEAGNGYMGGSIENSTRRQSTGNKSVFFQLQPGQSIGADPTKDELSAAIVVPFDTQIVKLQLNKSMVTAKGERITYNLTGKNTITPLPAYAATNPGTAEPGKFYPGGYFGLRFDSLKLTEAPVYHKASLESGMRYAVATFTAKNIFSKKVNTFDLYAGQNEAIIVTDTDGKTYKVTGDANYAFRHPTQDALLEGQELDLNQEVTYRYIFQVPKTARLASITFGQNRYGHIYKLNLGKL